MPMLVRDRNVVRRNGLVVAAANPSNEFIITDTFLVEMVKHPEQWSKTLRKDIAALRPFGNRIRVSAAIGECLRKEFTELRPTTREDLLPPEIQPVLAQFMQSTSEGGDLPQATLRKVADVLPALRAEQPLPEITKERTQDITRKLAARLPRKILSDLRNGTLHGDPLLCLIQESADKAYEADCIANNRRMLPHPLSMVRRHFILNVYRAMSWLQLSGLKTAKEERLQSDAYDDEYVLVGSYFDGVLSAEKRVNEADAALRRIISSASSDDLSAAFGEYRARGCSTP